MSKLPDPISRWFDARGWQPRRHQLEMLELARAGRSALLVAATGAGKTLAGFLPTICELTEEPAEGLHTLYVSPLKALAVDVQRNLLGPIEEMGLPIRVETRTGDTPSDRKARQRARPPHVLLTTPESLSLLLSYADAPMMFGDLRTIVVDELHAFAREKRGDLLSLSMARLEKLAPGLRRVGLSATISDPEAYRGWLAPDADIECVDVVEGDPGAEPDLSILIPDGRIPWSGHSGRHAAREVM
ncbi:MAG: DEAD/DEAH box helicase, partial [Sphingomicrobium sp.]